MDVPKGMRTPNAVFDCPHCGTANAMHQRALSDALPREWPWSYAGHRTVTSVDGLPASVATRLNHEIYRCVGCHKDTYFLVEQWNAVGGPVLDMSPLAGPPGAKIVVKAGMAIVHAFPVGSVTLHRSIPSEVCKATIEAEKSAAVEAANACATMVRRAMDALAQDKGGVGTNLFGRLEYLKTKGLLTPDLWAWAEELRILGRAGAHPEWEDATMEDAAYGLSFLREILRYVYINPYEREQRRLKETAAKKPKP